MNQAPTKVILASNASATTNGINLPGGKFLFTCVATYAAGTVKLQILGPDAATWLDVTGISFTAAGVATFAGGLPEGMYRVNIATATAVYMQALWIPE
jgi:hypothetical protein